MRELTCIVCPKGCTLHVDEKTFKVTGNSCSRGAEYGAQEVRDPQRTLTTTVILEGAARKRLPVKTDRTIPKVMMAACAAATNGIIVKAPVKAGDVIAENLIGIGVNLIAGCDMETEK
jgi:CxxC motif-containing protein